MGKWCPDNSDFIFDRILGYLPYHHFMLYRKLDKSTGAVKIAWLCTYIDICSCYIESEYGIFLYKESLKWLMQIRVESWFQSADKTSCSSCTRGWSGGAKVLCILDHWGVQLILAYSWARPAILVVGKGRGGMFLFLLFLHFHSCSSFFPVPLFHLLYSLFYLFSPFLWETTQNDPQGLTCR